MPDASKIDYLIRLGLGDPHKITWYRQIVGDPVRAIDQPIYRKHVGEVLHQVMGMILDDPQMYTRVQTLLQRSHYGLTREAEESLRGKARKRGIPMETVLEVYRRGHDEGGPKIGFDRVNSFLAGGKAVRVDSDLVEKAAEPSSYARIRRKLFQ